MINKNTNKNKGFSLIELLVVITIIGVLISVSFVGFSQARKSARDAKRKADLEQIRSALEIYRNDLKTYPPGFADCDPRSISNGSDVYMAEVPKDPLCTSQYYRYNKLIGANSYCLCAYLETLSVTQGTCVCGGNCGTTVACNYKLSNP
ncbi:type II secretion system GspH family protein [Patescibacteria group bacterium]|nr:type II secretion system GspH family protein [Patescibacteria group bacterium]